MSNHSIDPETFFCRFCGISDELRASLPSGHFAEDNCPPRLPFIYSAWFRTWEPTFNVTRQDVP